MPRKPRPKPLTPGWTDVVCVQCETRFKSQRSTRRYCSDRCRQRHARDHGRPFSTQLHQVVDAVASGQVVGEVVAEPDLEALRKTFRAAVANGVAAGNLEPLRRTWDELFRVDYRTGLRELDRARR